MNAYDDVMSHLATLYCMVFSIIALRAAIPLDNSIEAAVQDGTPVGNTQPTNASLIPAEESVSKHSVRDAPGVKAMSPEMKQMQQQMQDLMKKFSSSTSALDNAGESMRQMQAKINALEKEIAIAKHEKDQMTLEHQQGLANVKKQQVIFENKMQEQEMKMQEHMAEFEARDAMLRRKEGEAELHLQNIEERGGELQHLINYAKNVLHNLNQAEQHLRTEEERLEKASLLKRVSDTKTPDEGLNGVDGAAPNGHQLFGTKNSIQYNENDELLENDQEIQAVKLQLSKLREMATILQSSLLSDSDEEDVEGDVLEKTKLEGFKSKMQIVDAIGSALEIGSTSDHRGFLGDDSFDFDNVDDVKRQLSQLRDMALHLKSEEGIEEELGVGHKNEKKSLVDKNRTESRVNTPSQNPRNLRQNPAQKVMKPPPAQKLEEDSLLDKGRVLKQNFPMQMPMGRTFYKTPAERRGSLQAHMDKLRHYALEKYKWRHKLSSDS